MNGFVLMPGGGMSSWLWKDLEPLLQLKCIKPSYRIKNNTLENRKNSTLMDCVNYHIELIDQSGFENVILVGHSGAGALAALIGKYIPQKVQSIIYISANIPKNHHSAIDSVPLMVRRLNRAAIIKNVDHESSDMKSKKDLIKKYFCNDSSEQVFNYVMEQKQLSEPLCAAFGIFDFDNYPKIHQAYICLSRDHTISVKGQQKMMSHLGIEEQYFIESDHMVMLSHPQELAKILNSIAK